MESIKKAGTEWLGRERQSERKREREGTAEDESSPV